jgi:hypothetical protein
MRVIGNQLVACSYRGVGTHPKEWKNGMWMAWSTFNTGSDSATEPCALVEDAETGKVFFVSVGDISFRTMPHY